MRKTMLRLRRKMKRAHGYNEYYSGNEVERHLRECLPGGFEEAANSNCPPPPPTTSERAGPGHSRKT